MAQILQFKIKAEDQASPVLKAVQGKVEELEKSTQAIKPALYAAAAGFVALGAAAYKAIEAFAESELAQKRLNDALKIANVYTDAYSDHLSNVALELQNLTGVSDETIKGAQGLLASFGVVGKQLDVATEAALDFAKAQGIDLQTAATQLGKAFVGEVGALGRYGIAIDESIPKTERFEAVIGQLQKRFGGRAAGEGDTLIGSFMIFKEVIGDFFEAVGSNLTDSLSMASGAVSVLKEAFVEVTTFLAGSTEAMLRQQIKVWGELGGVFQFLGDKLPSWLGGDKFADIAVGMAETQNNMKAALADIVKDQELAVKAADKQFVANKNNLKAIEDQKKAAEALKKVQEDQTRLAELRAKYAREEVSNAQNRAVDATIKAGNIENIQALRDSYIEKMNLINLEGKMTSKQFELLAEQKKAYREIIEKLDDSIIKAGETAAQAQANKISGAAGALNTFSSGNVSGIIGAGVSQGASLLGAGAAAGPWGALAAAAVSLVSSSSKLPGVINKGIDDLIDGLLNGMPALFEYLSGDLIEKLMTELVPALVQSLARSIANSFSIAVRQLIAVVKNIPGLIKGIGVGLVDGFKGALSDIGDAFGFGDAPPQFAGLDKILKELEQTFKQLQAGLNQTVKNITYGLKSPQEKAEFLQQDFGRLRRSRENATDELFSAVISKDKEKIQAAFERIVNIQAQLIEDAQAGYDLEMERLDSIFKMKEEEYNEQRKAIQDTIASLKQFKETAVNAFKAVREAIIGQANSPEQNVEAARIAFQSAATPEAKAGAAQAYASALQNQFQALQQLAAQGAITGEEFIARQAEIVAALDLAETQTVNQFDRLIAVQESQLVTLDKGFAMFTASIDKQREELKAILLQMVTQLQKLPYAWVSASGNAAGVTTPSTPGWGFPRAFNENTAGLRATVLVR